MHAVDGVEYLRPEVALLFKAKHDRPKDHADLLAARLDPAARELAGRARLTCSATASGRGSPGLAGAADFDPGATGVIDQDWR